MDIYFCFYFNIAHDVVRVLLIFVNVYHCNYAFSHAHTEARTHKHTCMNSTQEEWRQPGTVHRYLKSLKQDKKIEQIEFRAKILDYFSWSNKSNINQSVGAGQPEHAGPDLATKRKLFSPLASPPLWVWWTTVWGSLFCFRWLSWFFGLKERKKVSLQTNRLEPVRLEFLRVAPLSLSFYSPKRPYVDIEPIKI